MAKKEAKFYKCSHKNGNTYTDKEFVMKAYKKAGFDIQEIQAATYLKHKKEAKIK